MISKTLLEKLNKQINLEFFSSNYYLQMSAWADLKGMSGSANFLKDHAAEEMMHMDKLFIYLLETGNMPVLGSIAAPSVNFESLEEMFRQALSHEKLVSKSIIELADAAMEEKDYSTFNVLQWFIAEQIEEEKTFSSIVDKFEMIGTDGRGLYLIDKEIEKLISAPAPSAQ